VRMRRCVSTGGQALQTHEQAGGDGRAEGPLNIRRTNNVIRLNSKFALAVRPCAEDKK
jgi:hypothetical protein